jgi:hypothetical protein
MSILYPTALLRHTAEYYGRDFLRTKIRAWSLDSDTLGKPMVKVILLPRHSQSLLVIETTQDVCVDLRGATLKENLWVSGAPRNFG